MNAREPRRRRPQGRQELFQKAAELFATNGYHGTAMSDLEHATGLGRGSIYHYVTSKDDLLYEITTQYLVRLITAGEDLLARNSRSRSDYAGSLARSCVSSSTISPK